MTTRLCRTLSLLQGRCCLLSGMPTSRIKSLKKYHNQTEKKDETENIFYSASFQCFKKPLKFFNYQCFKFCFVFASRKDTNFTRSRF